MAVVVRRTQQLLGDVSIAGLSGIDPMFETRCHFACAVLRGSVIQEVGVPLRTALENHHSPSGRSLNRLEDKRVRELSPVDLTGALTSRDLPREGTPWLAANW